jgi:hypothetical protein
MTAWRSSTAPRSSPPARESTEPFARVVNPQHYAGLWRVDPAMPTPSPAALGRDLADYATVVAGGGQ